MKPRQHFGRKTLTRADHRVALLQMLLFRRTLDGLDPERMTHSYGLPANEITAMIESERLRRETRDAPA